MDHFEIDEIKVFVDITLPTFNFANVSHGLSGVDWQRTLQMDHIRKYSIKLDQPNVAISIVLISKSLTNANTRLFVNICDNLFSTYTKVYFIF